MRRPDPLRSQVRFAFSENSLRRSPSDTQCRTGDQSLTCHGGLPVPVPTFAPALQCPVPASPGLQPWDPVPVQVLGQGLQSQSRPSAQDCSPRSPPSGTCQSHPQPFAGTAASQQPVWHSAQSPGPTKVLLLDVVVAEIGGPQLVWLLQLRDEFAHPFFLEAERRENGCCSAGTVAVGTAGAGEQTYAISHEAKKRCSGSQGNTGKQALYWNACTLCWLLLHRPSKYI